MSMILKLGNPSKNLTILRYNKPLFNNLARYASTEPGQQQQQQGEQQNQEPKRRTGLKVALVTLTGFGIGFAFTNYSSDLRKQIEASVPYSDSVFKYTDSLYESILQQIIALKNDTKQEPLVKSLPEVRKSQDKLVPIVQTVTESVVKPVEVQKPIVQKEQVKSQSTKQPDVKPKVEKQSVEQPKPVVQKSESTKQQAAASVQVQTDESQNDDRLKSVQVEAKSDWKEAVREHDIQEEAKIKAIEQQLLNSINETRQKLNEVKNNCKKSIESLNNYRDALKLALNEQDESFVENKWRTVTSLFDLQQDDVKLANEKIAAAKKTINDLDNLLVELKTKGFGKHVKSLRDTQFELIKHFKDLQYEKSRLSEAVISANVLRSYTNEQKSARNQFLKEIQSLQPEGIKGKLSEQLTVEELNSLLIHAHKRVIQLQNQINRIQASETQHIQAALDEQRNQFDKIQEDNVQSGVDAVKREFELEKEKIIENVKISLYEDLKKELSRQASAHNLHLTQMLKQQEEELESLYQKRLLIDAENIRSSHHQKVADGLGRLKGIEQALLARANLEFQAENAKKLWLAIQTLNESITQKTNRFKNLENIKATIALIKQSAPNNEFINTVLSSLDNRLVERGIWTEPDLKERFANVNNVCRKTALIDERGGSLLKYLISNIQSYFVFSTIPKNTKLSNDLKMDADSLNDTFILLDYANTFIEQNNFEMAIKLLNRLNGEPKRLANEWIIEALNLIEIKNACSLLNAYVSSIYIGSNFTN